MSLKKGSVAAQCSVTGRGSVAGQAGPYGAVTPGGPQPEESMAERERRLDATIAALTAFEAQHGSFADEHTAF